MRGTINLGTELLKSLAEKDIPSLYLKIYWLYFLGLLNRKEKNQITAILEALILDSQIGHVEEVMEWTRNKIVSGSTFTVQTLQEYAKYVDEDASVKLNKEFYSEVSEIIIPEKGKTRASYWLYKRKLIKLLDSDVGRELWLKNLIKDEEFRLIEKPLSRIWLDKVYGKLHISYGEKIQNSGILDLERDSDTIRICNVPEPSLGVYHAGDMTHLLYHRPGTKNIYEYRFCQPFYELGEERVIGNQFQRGSEYVVDDGNFFQIPTIHSTPFCYLGIEEYPLDFEIQVYAILNQKSPDMADMAYYKRSMIWKIFLKEINSNFYHNAFSKGEVEHIAGGRVLNYLKSDELLKVPDKLSLAEFNKAVELSKEQDEYRFEYVDDEEDEGYDPFENFTEIILHTLLQLHSLGIDPEKNLTDYLYQELDFHYNRHREYLTCIKEKQVEKPEWYGCFRFVVSDLGEISYKIEKFRFWEGKLSCDKKWMMPPNPHNYEGMIVRDRKTREPAILWSGLMQEIENFNFILPDIKDEFGYARDCIMNIEPYYVEQEEALGIEEFSANVLCKTYSFPNLFVSQWEEKTFYMLKISGSGLCILSEEKYNLFMEAMMERFEDSREKRRLFRRIFGTAVEVTLTEELVFTEHFQQIVDAMEEPCICIGKDFVNVGMILISDQNDLDVVKTRAKQWLSCTPTEWEAPICLELVEITFEIPEAMMGIYPNNFDYGIEDISEDDPEDEEYMPLLALRPIKNKPEDEALNGIHVPAKLLKWEKELNLNDTDGFYLEYIKDEKEVYLEHHLWDV